MYILVQNLMVFVTYTTPVIILAIGALDVVSGKMSLGSLIAFYSYMQLIYEPVQIINSEFLDLQKLEPYAERYYGYLSEAVEKDEGEEEVERGELEVKDLAFGYDEERILDGISFKVNEGEMVAVVGRNGSGKSSLMKIIVRLLKNSAGEIKVGGKKIEKVKLEDLRKKVIYTSSKDMIFTGTLKENITLFEEIPDEDVREAVQMAKIDFRKLDEMLSETNLSEGQKMRIIIARALARKPKVLILDETLSGIDTEIEKQILERLKNSDMTVFIISHRLSSIALSDKVIFIEKGEIKIGKHEELLKTDEFYAEILKSQLISS